MYSLKLKKKVNRLIMVMVFLPSIAFSAITLDILVPSENQNIEILDIRGGIAKEC